MSVADTQLRILIVEDERLVARDLQFQLEDMGHEVVANCDNWEDAVEAAETVKPDFALLDINIRGDKNGIEIAHHLRDWNDIPFLFLSAHSDTATLQRAGVSGPAGYLVKPVNDKDLRAGIQVAAHRHQAEKERMAMQRWLAATVQSLGEAVLTVDQEGRIKHINPMAEALLEVSRTMAIGQTGRQLLRIARPDGTPMAPITAALEGEIVMALDAGCVLTTPAGVDRQVTFSASPIRDRLENIDGAVIVLREHPITGDSDESSRELTARLTEARRLETIGSIARGVAHDFNNLFAAMSGNTDIALDELSLSKPSVDELNESLAEIRQAIDRGAELCRRIMTSSGNAPAPENEIDLGELVADAIPGLKASLKPGLELHFTPTVGSPIRCAAEPLTIRNAVQLLVDNAAESYGERPGAIEISVHEAALGKGELLKLAGGADLQPGRFALLTIADRGCGIPAHTMPRVFDPFFTTRFVGRGLGLAQVLGIAHSHNGCVRLESAEGKGTTVSLAFPFSCPGSTDGASQG